MDEAIKLAIWRNFAVSLRGDEPKGDADDRDIISSVNSKDTVHRREDAKKSNKQINFLSR